MKDDSQGFGNMMATGLRYDCDAARRVLFRYAKRGEFTNISSITTQITHLKTTSRVVHLKCTLNVSINPLPHTSQSLHYSNLSPSISKITHFCLKSFPQKVISPVTTPSEKRY